MSVNGSFEAPNGVVFQLAGGFEGEMFAGDRPHTVHAWFTDLKLWYFQKPPNLCLSVGFKGLYQKWLQESDAF